MERIKIVEVKEDILADNASVAEKIRQRLGEKGTLLVNLMASPGAGKTSFIVAVIKSLRERFKIAVLEADIQSTVDAEKVASLGIPTIQLQTGGFCHLDASMVEKGLAFLPEEPVDIIIIENVGNLVCPAEFDTGAHKNIMLASVPEGHDKPLKYPLMFSVCDALALNKIDLLKGSDFDRSAFEESVRKLNRNIVIFDISCKNGDGLTAFATWLTNEHNYFTAKPNSTSKAP